MKTKIGKYKPKTFIHIGFSDIVNLEMVLMRHIKREYSRRNLHPQWARGLQRMDIKDAITSLRAIKSQPLQYFKNVD